MMRFLLAWLQWTAIFAGTFLFGATWLGAQWVSWVPVAELVTEAGLLAFGLTLYCTRERMKARA